jgi:hypothetical protein
MVCWQACWVRADEVERRQRQQQEQQQQQLSLCCCVVLGSTLLVRGVQQKRRLRHPWQAVMQLW